MNKRLFIAFDLSVEVVERLVRFQEELHAQLPDDVAFRWTDPRNIHVTMKFFGEVDEILMPFIEERMEALAKPLFSFEVSVTGLGAFESIEEPRIVWAGFDKQGGEVLGLLQQTIDKEMEELGFAPDPRGFTPHVTLGRVKTPKTASLKAVQDAFASYTFGTCFIRDLALFESELTPSGPNYSVLNRFTLGV